MRDTIDMALEALGEIEWSNNSQWQSDRAKVAITAIKQARSAPVKQEPWCMKMNGCKTKCEDCPDYVPPAQPAPVQQEPEYWDVIDPAGNIVASETDAIRGWARIAGSYKPTVEGLLGFHDQGWRVLPKVTPPAAQRQWVGLTDNEIALIHADYPHPQGFARAIEAKLKEKNT